EAKEGANLSSEEWEASRKDQSDAAKKRRAALRASAAEHGVDEETIRTMEAVSDTTGRNYIWYTEKGKNNIENGHFDEKTGDVYLNTESKEPLAFVIGHELTHSTEGSAAYKTLREFALKHLKEIGVDVDARRQRIRHTYEEFAKEQHKNIDIDKYDFDAEIVADYAGRVLLQDAAEIENFVNARHDAAQRVWNWINDRLTRIAGDGALREQALLTRARELYGRALAQARPAEENAPQNTAQAPAQAAAVPAPASGNTAGELQPPAAGALNNSKPAAESYSTQAQTQAAPQNAPAQNAPAQNAPAQNAQAQARTPDMGVPAASVEEEDYDESGDEVERMRSVMRGADLTDEEGNAKYSVTRKDVEETREYIDSLPEQKKFSVSTPVEKMRTDGGNELIAVHNVDPADFIDTVDQYGGFPAWSLAVMKPGTKHSGFGSVSIIFKKTAVDPQADSRNKLYAGDAWTGTYNDLTEEEKNNADAEYVANKIGNKTPRRLDIPTFSSLAEAKASGLLMNESEMSRLQDEIREQHEIARKASRQPDEYMAAATKTLSRGILDAIDDETVREECRAAYNAMSDAQREYKEAQEELERAKKQYDREGGGIFEALGFSGNKDNAGEQRVMQLRDRIQNLESRIADLYDSLGEVEADPFAFDPDTMTADSLRDAISTYLTDEVHKALLGTAIDTVNGSDAAEAYSENTADAAGLVKRLLNEYEDIGLDIVSNYNDIRNSSEPARKGAVEKWRQLTERYDNGVTYFEAKPARVLGFGEVAGAALPKTDDGIDNTIVKLVADYLDDEGIPYEYYSTDKYDPDSVNAPDNRVDVVNRIASSVADAKFSITPREQEDVDSLDGGEIVIDDHGDTVADSDGSGHVKFSISTYDASGRALMDNWLKSHVKSGDLTEGDADDIRDSMEKMYSVCREYADKYGSFGAWSEAKVVADEKGNPVFSVVLPNSEYAMNIDFSTICKKRRALNAALNELIDRGVLDDMELDQQSIVKINQILDKHDFEIGCAICFVEAKRFRQASIVDSFVTLYNDMVRSMYPEGTKLGYHDYAGQDMRNGYSNLKPDFTHLNEIMKEYGSKTVEYKTASYLKNNPDARRLLNRSDFMTDRGIMAMRADKTGQRINSLYNSKKGTGGPKSSLGDMQYNHEIIGSRTRTFDRERAYAAGGVRIQSFSDYVAHMVFDYMEMVADLTAKKLPAHSYTKEADYARLFGLTGIKINLSLVPRFVEGGVAPGLDENGDYAWDKESFPYDVALEIENADGYGDN
ncbi:MAG: hypothetical protein LIQ26_02875, partial [Bacteroidota bacterium]|nr:hypothetical protein [Bacteroidota bacterium]